MDTYHYQHLSSPQYHPPSQPTTAFYHSNGKQSTELLRAQKKARSSGGTMCRAFMVGGLTITGVFGMGLAVVSYLCVAHKCTIADRHLVSTAPLGKALTLSQVASHIAPVTIPLLMSLTSYRFAAKWLNASANEGPNRPSPMQLGLLLSIFNSANIPSLISALKYFLGFGQTPEQKTFPSPPILRRSTLLLFVFLLNAYVISGSDAWLHVTSKAIIVESLHPYTGLTGALLSEPFGRAINGTKCDVAQSTDTILSFIGTSCGQMSGGSGGDGVAMMPGLRTLSNSSNIHRIAYTDDQTAIVVPSPGLLPSNISYMASSIGIKSSCKTITRECLPANPTSTMVYGPNAFLNIYCGSDLFNATAGFLMKALDDTGNGVSGYNISSNPFRVGAVITSMAYYDEDQYIYDDFVGNSGWFIHGNKGAWNVLLCDVAAVDVTYSYKSSTSQFFLKSSTPSSLRDARAMITFGLDMYRTNNPIATAVDGAGLQTDTTYEEEYALELSRQTIARGAVMFVTQNTTDITREEQTIGTSIDLIPFTIMLGMMVVYGLVVLVILIQAIFTVSKTSYVQLASAHLTDPLTTVHALYGPKDTLSTWQDKTLEKFGTESHGDRLNVGEFHDECGGTKFSVQKSGISYDAGSFGK